MKPPSRSLASREPRGLGVRQSSAALSSVGQEGKRQRTAALQDVLACGATPRRFRGTVRVAQGVFAPHKPVAADVSRLKLAERTDVHCYRRFTALGSPNGQTGLLLYAT